MDKKENKTKVVNCIRDFFDIYIGRPGALYGPPEFGSWEHHFGNPFSLKKDGNRTTVIKKFEKWIRGKEHKVVEPKRRKWILKNLYRLKNKRLGCYCSPKACHGDIYVKLIEELSRKRKNLLKTGEKRCNII